MLGWVHNHLMRKSSVYHKYHKNTYYNHHHFLVFLTASIVVAFLIFNIWQVGFTETDGLVQDMSLAKVYAQISNSVCEGDCSPTSPAPSGRYVDNVFTNVGVESNVVYSSNTTNSDPSGRDHKMDIYRPLGDGAAEARQRPLFVLVHGGGFTSGDKSRMSSLAQEYAKKGYLVASVNYRLREGKFYTGNEPEFKCQVVPEAMSDIQAAIRWFLVNKDSLRDDDVRNFYQLYFDPSKIVVGGVSAGAITALAVGYNIDKLNTQGLWSGDPVFPGCPASATNRNFIPNNANPLTGNQKFVISAIVDIAGGLGDEGNITDGQMERGDPALIIFHGDNDSRVIYEEAIQLADRARLLNVPYEFHTFPGRGHDLLSCCSLSIVSETTDFLYRYLFTDETALRKKPVVNSFDVIPVTTAGGITASYSATDDNGLSKIELWTAAYDNDGVQPECKEGDMSGCSWSVAAVHNFTTKPKTASQQFTHTPNVGTWWYGLHAVDVYGLIGVEPNPPGPIKVTKNPPAGGTTVTVNIVSVNPPSGTAAEPVNVGIDFRTSAGCEVFYYDDGNLIGGEMVPGGDWQTSFDNLTAGTHTLKIECVRSSTDSGSAQITYEVLSKSTPNTPPQITWDKPLDGDTVSGRTSIVVDVSDKENDAISDVKWCSKKDAVCDPQTSSGQTMSYSTTLGQWTSVWDTSSVSNGTYNICVSASDGKDTSTSCISVNVQNISNLPVVTIYTDKITPPSGTKYDSANVTVPYSVSEGCELFYYVNNNLIGGDRVPSAGDYQAVFDNLTAGTHTLKIECRGANGSGFATVKYVVASTKSLKSDLNCDGRVDVKDFGILLSWWGAYPDPAGRYTADGKYPACGK